jgi:hypothetical protein
MSDAELIARPRESQSYEWQDPIWETRIVAADRIEALTAKLAKAVEALEIIRDRQYYRMGPGITAQVIARATLAEIKNT